MRTSVPTRRRRRASESHKSLLTKNCSFKKTSITLMCSRPPESPCATHHVQSTHLIYFFLPLSVSPESALKWSSSFEELLKHSGQFVAPELLSKPVKSAFLPPMCFSFFFNVRLHLNCKLTSRAAGRSIVNGRQRETETESEKFCCPSETVQLPHRCRSCTRGDALWTSPDKLFITLAN